MSKGIVIELKGKTVLIMTPDGQFKQVAKQDRSYQLGEEISYMDTMNKPSFNWRYPRPFTIAAASVFCMMIVALISIFGVDGFSTNKVAAYVTMDINPSVEAGIDEHENVIELRGINRDGKALIKGIVYKGLSLDAFSDLIIERVEREHYLDSGKANIIISSTVIKKAESDYEVELAEKVKSKFIASIHKTHTASQDEIIVTAITAPEEVRKEAITQGVSTGKKALQLLTQNNNTATTDEDLKEKPIQQMITENGGIDKIIPTDRKVTKEQLKSLLKERNENNKDRHMDRGKAEDSKKDDSKKDDSKKDESKKDDSKKDESKKDDSKKDESKKDDNKKDDNKKNDNKKDDSKENDNKKNDNKLDDRKKNDSKKNESNKNQDKKDNMQRDKKEGKNNEDILNKDKQKNRDNQKDQKDRDNRK